MAEVTYIPPEGTSSVSVAGKEITVVDGVLTVTDAPSHIHEYFTKILKFAVATTADIEGIFDSKAAKNEKATLVALLASAGIKVDGRASLTYVQGQFDAALAKGLVSTPAPVITTESPAITTEDGETAATGKAGKAAKAD